MDITKLGQLKTDLYEVNEEIRERVGPDGKHLKALYDKKERIINEIALESKKE